MFRASLAPIYQIISLLTIGCHRLSDQEIFHEGCLGREAKFYLPECLYQVDDMLMTKSQMDEVYKNLEEEDRQASDRYWKPRAGRPNERLKKLIFQGRF